MVQASPDLILQTDRTELMMPSTPDKGADHDDPVAFWRGKIEDYKPGPREPAAEFVAYQLRRWIQSGLLTSDGARPLPSLRDLSNIFQPHRVGFASIRAALAALVDEGLLELGGRRGWKVLPGDAGAPKLHGLNPLARALSTRIAAGHFQPGDPLTIQRLMGETELPRDRVQSAISQLVHVDKLERRGLEYFVPHPDRVYRRPRRGFTKPRDAAAACRDEFVRWWQAGAARHPLPSGRLAGPAMACDLATFLARRLPLLRGRHFMTAPDVSRAYLDGGLERREPADYALRRLELFGCLGPPDNSAVRQVLGDLAATEMAAIRERLAEEFRVATMVVAWKRRNRLADADNVAGYLGYLIQTDKLVPETQLDWLTFVCVDQRTSAIHEALELLDQAGLATMDVVVAAADLPAGLSNLGRILRTRERERSLPQAWSKEQPSGAPDHPRSPGGSERGSVARGGCPPVC